ncbi:MAG: GAF domain-containing protein [Bacteroidetes bacterium]|nr:MAG: GAF domain-containing protein [Bacteroidota bacterium]RLD46719.1 MAG: GAF domain-containing protein [Bacteroidota bacterium]RLD86999.1 MAG: GAF domain-containing protein [Bacteroidota bacterium]HHJ10913.1 GAF domain-containing protein [Bacteroidota bacterium]
MEHTAKYQKYERLYRQIDDLIKKSSNNPGSNMSTIIAVLHHKIPYFFWTGFYILIDDKLQVGPYQGSLACIDLTKDTGVCWMAINKKETVVVPDVEAFPGHIACDSRSCSEIVVPLYNDKEELCGVLDVDSRELNSFDETDAYWLEKISQLVYHPNV